MKIIKCPTCNKKYNTGKFCLDCGVKLIEEVKLGVDFKPIKTRKHFDTIKKDIRQWLNRLGVKNEDIKIKTDNDVEMQVDYVLLNQHYKFRSYRQENKSDNLAAIEQLIHYRILGIERGIEEVEQAFKGYEALPDYTNGQETIWQVLGFQTIVPLDEARAKFKQMAKMYHPDLNPDKSTHEIFNKKKEAMDLIEIMYATGDVRWK